MNFKSFYLAVLLTTFFTTSEIIAQSFTFGPKVGYNSAKLSGNSFDNFHNNNSLDGMHAGVFLEFRFNKFAIQPEVLYSTEGGEIEVDMNNETLNHNLNLDYVIVPLMFKYYLTNSIAVEAGPQIGFLMDKENRFGNLNFEEAEFNDLNISGNVGISINLPLSLMLSARYNVGFTNVAENFEADWKHKTLQVSLGLRF